MSAMTYQDNVDAAVALCDWFASQDIAQNDAIFIMAILIAGLVKEGVKPKNNVFGLFADLLNDNL